MMLMEDDPQKFDVTDEGEARKWLFRENIRLKQWKDELEREREHLEEEKKNFQMEQHTAERQRNFVQQQMEREKQLFEMKWKILEEEFRKLAADRVQINREREELHGEKNSAEGVEFRYSVFFVGVTNRLMLKKRYKDLIKIFHPDNLAGDNETLQEINREYDSLKQIFI